MRLMLAVALSVVLSGCAKDAELAEICMEAPCVCVQENLLLPKNLTPVRFSNGKAYCARGKLERRAGE